MSDSGQIFRTSQLHHAYCLINNQSSEPVGPLIFQAAAEAFGVPRQANPDFWHLKVNRLSVEQGHHHQIRQWHSRRALYGRKICVIEAGRLSLEAQNALLKVFEDTNPDCHFVLVLPHLNSLLPTLSSRLQFLTFDELPRREEQTQTSADQEPASLNAEEFFAWPPARRLARLKTLIDQKAADEAYSFLSELEKELSRRYRASTEPKYLMTAVKITKLKEKLSGRSPSVKGILEYIAVMGVKQSG